MSIAAIALTLAVLLSRRGEEILDPLFHNRWPDQILMSTALFSWSVPDFWLSPAFAVVFALGLGWFPTGDWTSIEQGVTEWARSIALPSLALALTQMGFVACVARDSMLDVLNQDYVRTAAAWGLWLLAETALAIDEAAAEAADQPAPAPPAVLVTRPGNLWLLGRHRLLCGDATSAVDVARLLDGARPHLMVTDPPYGVDYDPAWRNEAGVSTTLRTGRVANDNRADWREAWALFPGDVAYVWHAGVHARTVIESLEAAGFAIRSQIVWAKPRLVLGRGDYHWQHEPCLYVVRKGATAHWQGARDQTTLWQIAMVGVEDDAETVHGTRKPLECKRRPIVNNSALGEAVYDPFLGSGTTLIAAEFTGRVCVAMEIDPRYCDVAIERWQRLTGSAAILDGDGRRFADLKDQRVAA
jgi:DNA modification methylase